MKLKKFWSETEFVNFEEYADFGMSGKQYDRNYMRSMAQGVAVEDMCPLCAKALKDGSYKILTTTTAPNGTTNYYYNPNVVGEKIKVGNGCFRRLMQAYRKKYEKYE
jgi:hypothetical protein